MKYLFFLAVLLSMSHLISAYLLQCPLHKCRNIDDGRRYLLNRTLSSSFPYSSQQNQRKPTTRYIVVQGGQPLIDFVRSKPGRFLAYDSKYDPIFDPCIDCDESGTNGEYCNYQKCYAARVALVGQN